MHHYVNNLNNYANDVLLKKTVVFFSQKHRVADKKITNITAGREKFSVKVNNFFLILAFTI